MSQITHYQVKQFDSLESIAGRYLGNPDRWTEIVQANSLRFPFISSDPKDHLGTVLASGTLGSPLLTGENLVDIPLDTPELATVKSVFCVSQILSSGRVIQEFKVLAQNAVSFGGTNVRLVFTEPIENNFDSMAVWNLVSDPALQSTKVVKPGDTILLYNALISDKVDTMDEFTRLLGADISLDENTRQIEWDSATNDFKLTKGVKNLAQALRLKVMTNQGDLVYHPNYGDRLLQYVGSGNTAIFAQMANGFIRECITQDPRIFSVENVVVDIQNDVCSIDLKARVRGLDTLVQVTSLGIDLK